MKRSGQLTAILITFILIPSCIEEDIFGLSGNKQVRAFEIPGQAGPTTINPADNTVIVPFAEGADVSALAPTVIEISNLASIEPGVGEVQDFRETVSYIVTAEDGSVAEWEVTAVIAEPTPQLENSNFDAWYDAGGYSQPGESDNNTLWDTANPGLAIVGQSNTTPGQVSGTDLAARLVSIRAPLFVRMAAGTLYTGSFTDGFPDPTDPRSNITFGTPFAGRPDAFRIDYRYLPGEQYLDGDGNPLPGSDEADLYVLLEKRENDQVERIGTGWLRTADRVEDWTTIEVSITYGELTSMDPEFAYANILAGESWGDPGDRPTHIVVVFSSSALGDSFTGAIGSELWVNNFELVY
ncbi:MAG: PCMD domain-containing protein [Cytophagales bacterium]|nr:PCMD domain-containing protein [Cytophagales bacterium]